jgi:DNA-binding NtrC family response regulator
MKSDGDLRRILIVDDDATLLAAMERLLRGRFNVSVATDGKRAIQFVTSDPSFAVVVADLRMPGMDGLALLFCLRAAAPDSVGVLLTGHADLEAAITAVNQGNVFRFLTKPCSPSVLLDASDAAVEQHRLIAAGRASLGLPASSAPSSG